MASVWDKLVSSHSSSLRDVMAQMNESGAQISLIVDANFRLLGVITDGDIRRHLVNNPSLETRATDVMNPAPATGHLGMSRNDISRVLQAKSIHHLPIIDNTGQLVDVITQDQLFSAPARIEPVVLMAGGLGTRLRPLTENIPKPLLPVAGKPILVTILEQLQIHGFRQVYISIGYRGEQIRDRVGDGSEFGLKVEYIEEPEPLGTAGALHFLRDVKFDNALVMNADLLTTMDFSDFMDFHGENHAVATVTLRKYRHEVPFGVVDLDGSLLRGIREKPVYEEFISAGIYGISHHALDYVPFAQVQQIPELLEALIEHDEKVQGFVSESFWMDIGRIDEYERAQELWTRVNGI